MQHCATWFCIINISLCFYQWDCYTVIITPGFFSMNQTYWSRLWAWLVFKTHLPGLLAASCYFVLLLFLYKMQQRRKGDDIMELRDTAAVVLSLYDVHIIQPIYNSPHRLKVSVFIETVSWWFMHFHVGVPSLTHQKLLFVVNSQHHYKLESLKCQLSQRLD